MNFIIRPITKNDNPQVKQIVLTVLAEFGCVGSGYASNDKEMYLESTPQLSTALALYEKSGFKKLSCHKGNTGHQKSCSIYMSKDLI